MQNLNELAKQIHENAKAKGFWDEPRNTGEIFMLIVSELAEALEASRKGKQASLEAYELYKPFANFDVEMFKAHVKDTFEDELADVVIRILDFCFVENIDIEEAGFSLLKNDLSENTGENLLRLCGIVCKTYDCIMLSKFDPSLVARDEVKYNLNSIVATIFSFSELKGFDLMRHIKLKMQYNATREHKHGKKY